MYTITMTIDASPNNAVYAGSATVPVAPVAPVPVTASVVGAAAPVGPAAAGVPVDPAVVPTPLAAEGDTPLIYESVRKSIDIHFPINT